MSRKVFSLLPLGSVQRDTAKQNDIKTEHAQGSTATACRLSRTFFKDLCPGYSQVTLAHVMSREEHLYQIFKALEVIDGHLHKIMDTQAQTAAKVQAVTNELVKVGTETRSLLTKIDDLTAIINTGAVNTSPELQAAVDALTAQAQLVDDLVPDAPPPTPTPTP